MSAQAGRLHGCMALWREAHGKTSTCAQCVLVSLQYGVAHGENAPQPPPNPGTCGRGHSPSSPSCRPSASCHIQATSSAEKGPQPILSLRPALVSRSGDIITGPLAGGGYRGGRCPGGRSRSARVCRHQHAGWMGQANARCVCGWEGERGERKGIILHTFAKVSF